MQVELNDDALQYSALWAHPQVENQWLRMFVLVLLILLGGTGWFAWKGWDREVEKLYVKEYANGRATIEPGTTFANHPGEVGLRHFLTRFVYLHYSRRKAVVAVDYPASLYFVHTPLAKKLETEWISGNALKKALELPYDLDVKVQNVILRNTEKSPFDAEVDYLLQSVEPNSGQVLKTQSFTVTIRYTLPAGRVPNSIIPFNPYGINIDYFREDETFQRSE